MPISPARLDALRDASALAAVSMAAKPRSLPDKPHLGRGSPRPTLSAGFAALALAILPLTAQAGSAPTATRVAETYRNPILAGDWAEPDVVRVGVDYYLTASSFVNLPGLPVLHSRDLVHWTIIAHALERLGPDDHYRTPRKGGGVWAPAIRFHAGLFRIYYPDPDFGIYVVMAKNPAGPWSPPKLVDASRGAIDPAPFWDDDGVGWLVHGWARSRAGFANRLTLKRLSADGSRTLDQGVTIIEGAALPPVQTSIGPAPWETIEGPKLYRRGGYYYIFAPAGGVKPGWQAVFRARRITGPYEGRNVLDQGQTPINGPHQGAWVDTGLGEDWFVHFQDADSYGRRIHLQPVSWRDDWPVIGEDPDGDGRGQPVLCHAAPKTRFSDRGAPQANDAFSASRLSLAWQWNSNPASDWANLKDRAGWLRLRATPGSANLYEAGALLTQKLPAEAFTVETVLDFKPERVGEAAGLGMFGYAYGWVGLERRADGVFLVARRRELAAEGGGETLMFERRLKDAAPVRLRLSAQPVQVKVSGSSENAAWPAKTREFHASVRFAYSLDGRRFETIDGLFQSRQGRWTGAQIGLFALASSGTPAFVATSNGHADFDLFEISLQASTTIVPGLTPVQRCPA